MHKTIPLKTRFVYALINSSIGAKAAIPAGGISDLYSLAASETAIVEGKE